MCLLQHVIDESAKSDPDGIAYIIPRSEKNVDQDFEEITNFRFANAVNRAAAWIQTIVKGPSNQTLAFIASQDIRYLIFILAANKAGHRLLLLSPRNSQDAQKHLLGVAECRYFLAGRQYEASSKRITTTSDTRIEVLVIPDVWDVLNEESVDAILFATTWEEARHKPFVTLHTSGTTTGRPKPIVLNHGYYLLDSLLKNFPKIDGKGLRPRIVPPVPRTLYAMPMFHVGALFWALFKRTLQGAAMVLLPGDTQIEAGLVVKALVKGKCTRVITTPTIIENLMDRPDGRDSLARLDSVGFGSGPMAPEVGDALLKLNPAAFNVYGSTEMNALPTIELDDPVRDWQYMQFHPWSGATFEPIGGDDRMCELVIKPVEHPAYDGMQPAFENWPNSDEYRSKDIFVPHPSKKNLWKWYSRADDVITFETGEKLNPSTMESIISAHPKVASAVIIGQRRMQPALLIEPIEQVTDHHAFLSTLWPTIQKANAEAPAYGQLVKQLVLFSEEPFKRTPKGTIQRTKTEEHLAQEIASLYDGGGESIYGALTDLKSEEAVKNLVGTIAHDILILPGEFDENSNLFDHGLDSLKASEFVRAANGVLKKHSTDGYAPPRIDVSTVYGDPTIKGLSSTIFKLSNDGQHVTKSSSWSESAKRILSRHTPTIATGAAILTGSTGSLGAHLLHILLRDETYSHIYCLNRSGEAQKAYLDTFPSDSKLLSKVTFLQTSSIWAPLFGLSGGRTYEKLLDSVRTVIHNAWPVNFLMPVEAANPGSYPSSFEPQFDGVANLLRFCAASSHKARFVYISSLSSVSGGILKPIPEAVVIDDAAPDAGGYPRSKWVTEVMMDSVARENPFSISRPIVIRPGQISGPLEESVEKGAAGVGSVWNKREAISSIFISSSTVGAIPSSIGHEEKLRWVPVDVVAKTTLEVVKHVDRTSPAESVNQAGASAYNVINIQSGKERTWNDITPIIQTRLEKKLGKEVPIISMAEWIQKVEAFGSGDGRENPAAKLTEFMTSLAESSADDGFGADIDTDTTKKASRSLRELQPVQPEWIEYWMRGWGL